MKLFFGSMSGRVFLMLFLGILASTALTWWLASGERQRAIGQFRDYHTVERAEQLILAVDAILPAKRDAYLAAANRPSLHGEILPPGIADALQMTEFSAALTTRLKHQYPLAALTAKLPVCSQPSPRRTTWFGPPPMPTTCERVDVHLHDQTLLRLSVLPQHNPPPPPHLGFISTMALFWCSIGMLAFFVARMTMGPLKQLAQAAKDLGNDINHPPLLLAGASEIRQASAAFNAMQARIRQHIQQRTQMLAAITHDLQTPLTRLRLRLEKVADDELRDKLAGDLSAMQDMVREGLDLARSMDSAEAMQAVDLDSVLDSVCADAADAGQAVTLGGRVGIAVMARPMALRRCLINLIDNAVKYGQYAHVTVERDSGAGACIRIRDGGEGIAQDQLQRVFEPFYRIETSRSRESGGTGLGLTIARNIVEQHGGCLALLNHLEGGLEVLLKLPQHYAGR
jgi:signal transduction histidine kinase